MDRDFLKFFFTFLGQWCFGMFVCWMLLVSAAWILKGADMTWKLEGFVSEAGNLVQHIVPVDDLYEHELMPTCWCKPRIDPKDFLAIHNSADEREKFENGERKPS